MAQEDRNLFRTNGSAAYDIDFVRYDGNAVPKPKPAQLPEDRPAPRPKEKQRAKLAIAPFAAVGLLVVAVMLIMVVYSYVRLYEATSQVGELNRQLSSAQQEATKLRSAYESRIDLADVERQAKELGMRQPTARQTVYLNVPGADHTEVLRVDERGFLRKAYDAVTDSFHGILDYFH